MYDPLTTPYPASEQPLPDSYWAGTTEAPSLTSPLENDINADIAIIGGGYTGLSTAIHLAKQADNKRIVLLEANQTGWGCSGRNGGFVLAGTGRLSVQAMEKKWGEQTTLDYPLPFI